MENSSKALLIAAAVLIVILIIALGVKIFNSPKDVVKDATDVGGAISSQIDSAQQSISSSFDVDRNSPTTSLPENSGTGTVVTPTTPPSQTEENEETKLINGVEYATTTQVTDDRGKTFYIPKGYSVVRDESTNNNVAVDEGAVIQDQSGNQWVWIPASVSEISEVVDGKNVGKLYNFTTSGATAMPYSTENYHEVDVYSNWYLYPYDNEIYGDTPDEEFRAHLQTEFDNMLASVQKYGGYYIGRYETGGTIANPVVKKGATVLSGHLNISNLNVDGTLYTSAKKLKANDSVTTNIAWGCQWDNTLRWLANSGNRTWAQIYDSTDWGNYSDGWGTFRTARL